MNRFGRFIVNGSILTLVALFMRTVSVIFNIYISNTVGAEGLGVFTLISTAYGFAITVAVSGVNLSSTRLISEAIGERNLDSNIEIHKDKQIICILKKCILYSLLFSVSVSIILYFGSEFIGYNILYDSRTIPSLKLLSFTLTPISLSAVFSGYFVSVRRVYKNAITQVSSQFIRIFTTIILFGNLFSNDTEKACLYMVIGCTVSEIASLLIQVFMYLAEKQKPCKFSVTQKYEKQTTKKVFGIAIPVALSAYLRSGLISIEHILIPIGLEKSGADKTTALSSYGILQSMVFPLVLFPSAILSSFASLLLPEITESQSAKDYERIKRISSKVIRTALIFSIGVAGIILFFANELGATLYPQTNAGIYIAMISPLIPIMYIDTSVDAILKGLGQQVYIMAVNIIDSALSVILVIILIPKHGILGYVATVYFTELINACLSITRLLSITKVQPKIFEWIVKPLLSIICATFLIKFVFNTVRSFISLSIVFLCIFVLLSIVVYIIFLFIFNVLKISQIKKLLIYSKKSIQKN